MDLYNTFGIQAGIGIFSHIFFIALQLAQVFQISYSISQVGPNNCHIFSRKFMI
ncbi:hypothetical protein RhiirA1_484044 [Rhizophagus irregularis]|uniref:Uncharacterized protein n=1 Tax=Rhizophagus irregularis TaxID=588596 RepID=A0A2N0QJT8_9GLOM|nr:hypothetical protein RhiirA1_484044 [Rhizophagus irregularis]